MFRPNLPHALNSAVLKQDTGVALNGTLEVGGIPFGLPLDQTRKGHTPKKDRPTTLAIKLDPAKETTGGALSGAKRRLSKRPQVAQKGGVEIDAFNRGSGFCLDHKCAEPSRSGFGLDHSAEGQTSRGKHAPSVRLQA